MKKYCFLLALICLLVACQQTPANQGEMRFAIAQAPINLDPRFATDAASERVNRLIYQRLVEFDAASKATPSLANWQQLSPTQYQFTLKKLRASFHDGKPLNAADVVATYQSVKQLSASPHAAEFANIQTIKALDTDNILFTLKQVDKYFAEKLIIGILPAELIQQEHAFHHVPVGSGPMKFISWQDALVLENTNNQKRTRIIEVKDPTVRVLKLVRGEVDLMQGDLPPELVKYLSDKPEITVKTNRGANFSYLGLNMQDPVLKKLKVRQAITHAIDRDAVIQQVMVKSTRPASVILPPEHYAGNAKLAPYEYKPEFARRLLIDAGIDLPLKLVYKTSTDAQRVRLATILQAQMAAAGIELEIRSLDWGTFFEEVKKGKFQLYGLTWVGIKTPEIYSKVFASDNVPPKGFNRGRYSDKTLDGLLKQEKWQAATQRIYEQLPYIPLWYEGQFAAYNKTIKAYAPQPDGNWDGLAHLE